jgi:hypothetical protein
MRIKNITTKKFLRFVSDSDCAHTITTKQDLLGTFRDYAMNANDPRYADSVSDDSWQIGIKKFDEVVMLDSSYNSITTQIIRDAEFILYYNPCKFQAWVGNAEALKQFGGEFTIEKRGAEL